jgi:hypothetical protein
MEKINNKIFRLAAGLLVAVMAFVVNVASTKALVGDFVNYYNIEMTNAEYNRLLNLGFTEEQIYYMPRDIFEENKDLEATLIGTVQKYYKTVYPTYGNSYTVEITPFEYYNHGNGDDPLGSSITTYKTLLSSISAVGSYYRFNSVLSWNNIPSVHSYDVQAIGYSGLIHVDSTITFYYTYATSNGSSTTSYNYYNKQNFTYGGSTVFQLPSSFVGLTSTMYYNVAKDANAGTITSLHICADYAHATTSVTGNQASSHNVNIGGIIFDSSVINKFDSMSCADEYASVNW